MDTRPADPTDAVRADFDAIARLEPAPSAPNPLIAKLLRHLPERCDEVLEVGCGTGEATRMIAGRARRVVACDLSPEMIRVARERSTGFANIDYQVADATRYDYPEARFDAVVSIATLHHLPFEPTLDAFARTLRPGGVLLILDLLDRGHPAYLPLNLLAALSAATAPLRGEMRQTAELRRAYLEHGAHEKYLRPRDARDLFRRLLPGARVRHHLRWRYSAVWTKPGVSEPQLR
jgi:SAM-dependent methyltransferase